MAILSAKDIIANKTKFLKKTSEFVVLNVEGLGACKFKVPDHADTMDIAEMIEADGKNVNDRHEYEKYTVYNQMVEPDLSDAELVKVCAEVVGKNPETAVTGPWMVWVLMKMGQAHNIVDLLATEAGYGADSVNMIVDAEAEGAVATKN